jgi:hypothetical protein
VQPEGDARYRIVSVRSSNGFASDPAGTMLEGELFIGELLEGESFAGEYL